MFHTSSVHKASNTSALLIPKKQIEARGDYRTKVITRHSLEVSRRAAEQGFCNRLLYRPAPIGSKLKIDSQMLPFFANMARISIRGRILAIFGRSLGPIAYKISPDLNVERRSWTFSFGMGKQKALDPSANPFQPLEKIAVPKLPQILVP